ncbi:MAG: 2-amino-4-hydroxy-6-hydroxymethyldihydropteridine diphosphokinase [Planctomycetes bacterium]|nr:2-amino-4-hydroxy-6-hydroxymethyldihydropteridine diphosphokinase [Planctomycetota bacterium]NUQ34456.1 2-amino-4-hydroxy-6-hydroxymethyldihydropteridine diphosphokinase [Planctomycetaceae bacterium]
MTRYIAYIGLGSNLGDRAANLRSALTRIGNIPNTSLIASSPFLETPPVDCPPGSPDFLNAVCGAETSLDAHELMMELLRIEHDMGRRRADAWHAPRIIDLDLLLLGDVVIDTPEVIVPHPRMHERTFVLVPLAQVAPEARHPVMKKTAQDLLASLEPLNKAKARA